MRIVLEPGAFATGAWPAGRLVQLLMKSAGELGPRVLPVAGSHWHEWLAERDVAVRDDLRAAIETSVAAEARAPSTWEVRVANPDADTGVDGHVIRATLDDAVRLAEWPLRILVENARSDRAFLHAMARKDHRRALSRAVELGRVVFEHGTGLPEMAARITEIADARGRGSLEWTRWRIVFDSDALVPGVPSKKALEVQARADATLAAAAAHRLWRRFAESYLPSAAFRWWLTRGTGEAQESREARVEAWERLPAVVKHHFNVKKGLGRDEKRLRSGADQPEARLVGTSTGQILVTAFFDDHTREVLNDAARGALRHGFNDVSKHFLEQPEVYATLPRDDVADEFDGLFDALLAAI